jgi:hypothetical protein
MIKYLFALILFASCSTVHKQYSKELSKTDSTVTTRKDSSVVKAVDSLNVKESSEEYDKETVIIYDTATIYEAITPTSNGKIFQKIKSITIREKGKVDTKELTQVSKKDTAHETEHTQVQVQQETKAIVKDKQSSRMPLPLIIGLVVACVGGFALFLVYRRSKQSI